MRSSNEVANDFVAESPQPWTSTIGNLLSISFDKEVVQRF